MYGKKELFLLFERSKTLRGKGSFKQILNSSIFL